MSKPETDKKANPAAEEKPPVADAKQQAADKKANEKPVPMLRIRSLDKAGFRRAGMKFDAGGTEIARADLSDEQYEAIMAEPRLAIEPFNR
jgi:hypothetical protein